MAIASRLLSRLKKVYGAQVALKNELDIIHSSAKKGAAETFPPISIDGILSIKSRKRIARSSCIPLDPLLKKRSSNYADTCGFSGVSDVSGVNCIEDDFTTFFKSAMDKDKGPGYFWINKKENHKESLKKNGAFIVLVGMLSEDASINCHPKRVSMFETLRFLQHRYPLVQVFGFQSGSSVCSLAVRSQILKTIIEEYITFPVLIAEKEFTGISNEPCYLLFRDLTGPCIHHRWDIQLGTIVEDLELFDLTRSGKDFPMRESEGIMVNYGGGMSEPHACSPFRNLLLYYPSCISADSEGNRLFLSDTNHHRIIITNGDGKILDCIGGSPGFEDGDFDSSKLLRPAGLVYHADEDCLYFVDAENCAVRKADLGERVVETLYPAQDKKVSDLWSWILEKVGIVRRKADVEVAESDKSMFACPWHLFTSDEDEDLLVFSRSFHTLWVMSMASGKIKQVREGCSNNMDAIKHILMERSSLLKEIISDPKNSRNPSLISSIVNLQNDILYSDALSHRVLKCQKGSGHMAEVQFSNFGVLGLPYWVPRPIENVALGEQIIDDLQGFDVLPGRCELRVKVQIPEGTKLAAPLSEDCVWRQARGAAAEISAPALAAASVDKVGIAQQWFDELDNLAFSAVPVRSTTKYEKVNDVDAKTVIIDCAVNASPGSSEVVISAVLYLRLEGAGNRLRERARRLLGVEEKSTQEACVDLLLEAEENVGEIVFARPLHLRVRLDCGDLPAATSSKDRLPVDSSLEVNVRLT